MIAYSAAQVVKIAVLVGMATFPLAGAAKQLRIVFAVEEDGNLPMWLADRSPTIFRAIRNQTRPTGFKIAVVGFGRTVYGAPPRNPRTDGQPVLLQRCSNEEADFLTAISNLQDNGNSAPGFQTIREIAGNNINPSNETCCSNELYGNGPVCDDLLNGDGFCLIMVAAGRSDVLAGESAANAAADLLGVGGVFSIIGSDDYAPIADMTGGGQHNTFVFLRSMEGMAEIMTKVVSDCVRAMDDTPTETPTQNPVRPPIDGAPPLRVLFAVDETGSMAFDRRLLTAHSPTIFNTVQQQTRSLGFDGFEIAVVGFGRREFISPFIRGNPRIDGQPILHQRCSNQEADFLAAVNDLQNNGRTAPGFQTIREIAGNNINPNNETWSSSELYGNGPICDDLLDGKGFCVVMLTNENSDVLFPADSARNATVDLVAVSGVFSIVGDVDAQAAYATVANATGGGQYDLATLVNTMAGAEEIMTNVILDCAGTILEKSTVAPTMGPTTMVPTTTMSPTALPTNVPAMKNSSCAPVKVPKKRLRPSRLSKAIKAPKRRDFTKAPKRRDFTRAPKRRDFTKAPKRSKAKASKAPSNPESGADDGFRAKQRAKHAKARYSYLTSTAFPSLCPDGAARSPPT